METLKGQRQITPTLCCPHTRTLVSDLRIDFRSEMLNTAREPITGALTDPLVVSVAANQCKCTGGVPASSYRCRANGLQSCSSCSTGFHLMYKSAGNQCVGAPAPSTYGSVLPPLARPMNYSIRCVATLPRGPRSSTLTRYWPSVAAANQCTCQNGQGARGVACAVNKRALCASCTKGFTLVNGICTGAPRPDLIAHPSSMLAHAHIECWLFVPIALGSRR